VIRSWPLSSPSDWELASSGRSEAPSKNVSEPLARRRYLRWDAIGYGYALDRPRELPITREIPENSRKSRIFRHKAPDSTTELQHYHWPFLKNCGGPFWIAGT
jgi:hypothetical protein